MNSFFSEYPYLSVKVKVASQKSEAEAFSLALGGSLAIIEATSSLAVSYAKAQLLAGLQAKTLGDIVGANCPQFCIRPLWLDSLDNVLPESLIDLGYNTLIISYDLINNTQLQELQKSHIKVAILCSSLEQCSVDCDYIVWQQGSFKQCHLGFKKDLTPYEQALAELQIVQQQTQKPVFYYTKPACPYLRKLAVNAGSAVIVFDAHVDEVLSGVFAELTGLALNGENRLLPVIVLPQLQLADGQLVTDVPVALIENILGRQRGGRFIGAACRTGLLRCPEALAQMPLWVIGQRMWRAQSVLSLVESWFARYHPEWVSVLSDKILQILHALFYAMQSGNVEQGVKALLELADALSCYKAALRFQKITKSQEGLSLLLFELQLGFKAFFEQVCAKTMLKTPLTLQNFIPVGFHSLQKSFITVK
jgi:hypothetical protein